MAAHIRRDTRVSLLPHLARTLLTLALLVAYALPALPALASEGAFAVAVDATSLTLDPADTTDDASLLAAEQIYDTIVGLDAGDLRPTPALAASWSASADARVWSFFLRPGVTFHDGEPLDAAAVVYNIERWWDPAHPSHQGNFTYFRGLFGGFKGDANCLLSSVQVGGPLEVVITLARPDSTFLSILGFSAFSIASPAALAAGTLASHPVGTGPFQFQSNTAGNRLRLQAFAAHWRGAPRSATLDIRLMPDPADRLAAVQAGTVQVARGIAGPASNPELRVVSTGMANMLGYLGINQAHAPFDQVAVRQALARAVNKPHLLAAAYGADAQAADQFLPPRLWGRDETIADPGYAPDVARDLLADAGFTNGITTTLAYRNVVRAYLPDPVAAAQALQADMAAAGIHLELVEYPSGEFIDKAYAGELDLFLLGWGMDLPHPDNFFTPHFCDRISMGPVDAAFCTQLDDARTATELPAARLIYQAASRHVHDAALLVPLVNVGYWVTIRFDAVGVEITPTGAMRFREARVGGADFATAVPAAGATLSIEAGDRTTTAQIPPGAVDEATTFHMTEADAPSAPDGQGPTGHAFTLEASRDGEPLDSFAFTTPVTLTVTYSESDLLALWEDSLAIYFRNGDGWTDVASTCTPPSAYIHDEAANTISVAVCHLSHFALFGERWPTTWLPMVEQ